MSSLHMENFRADTVVEEIKPHFPGIFSVCSFWL